MESAIERAAVRSYGEVTAQPGQGPYDVAVEVHNIGETPIGNCTVYVAAPAGIHFVTSDLTLHSPGGQATYPGNLTSDHSMLTCPDIPLNLSLGEVTRLSTSIAVDEDATPCVTRLMFTIGNIGSGNADIGIVSD